jgi:hypothetical protein
LRLSPDSVKQLRITDEISKRARHTLFAVLTDDRPDQFEQLLGRVLADAKHLAADYVRIFRIGCGDE